ncbi:eCIS core domain-containing protein [Streptomyces sp. NBC_01451]|uniref:eCIS core domain-containing protein n=1 Tax=Streptomyces sp. NBC_01451 TaxID=2903872 RepID=UPI002E31B7F1|nr:DUF4157 domain-containing protein [Streptomyces sp. NBC_01451]
MSLDRAEHEADVAATAGGPDFRPSALHAVPESERRHAHALTPRSAGVPLAPAQQRSMGARFAFDFGRVRVHSDGEAGVLAADAHARAYTVGDHVVFGAGQYAPDTPGGQALLAHELTHVVQQSAAPARAVQCQDAGAPAPAPVADPEVTLGQRLLRDFPSGVAVAFYAPMPDQAEEARNAAQRWAVREQALAVGGKAATAANTVFGQAMSDDDHPLAATLTALGTLLGRAVRKATAGPNPDPGPGARLDAGAPPGAATAATVRTLAVFAHGTSNWCGLGRISSSTAASVIKSIAPALAPDVTVVLYSCNAGREPDAGEDWVKGTMRSGGKSSLAATVRDALVTEGRTGSVWGHTTTGHVTRNFALREFTTASGKGSEGGSYVMGHVFTDVDRTTLTTELLDAVRTEGYEVTAKGLANVGDRVEHEMYRCYAEANQNLTIGDGTPAESAPVHPDEVGGRIRDYWTVTYWPGRRSKAVRDLVRELVAAGRVRKVPQR